MPYVTRRTESFGVSIPEEIYHLIELKEMRKKYGWQIAWFAIAILLFWVLLSVWMNFNPQIVFVYAIFAFLIGSFFIYLRFHSRMKILKAKEKWQDAKTETIAVDIGFHQKKIVISHWWYLIPFAVSFATLILSLVFYSHFPAKIPMHMNASGQVDRWESKSYRAVLFLPLLQLYFSALFLFINGVITKSKQQIDSSDPERSAAQSMRFRRKWSIFNLFTGLALVCMFSFMQLSNLVAFSSTLMIAIPFIVTAGIIIYAVVLSFTTGQGGSRIKLRGNKNDQTINRDDDRFWKVGLFYFNPKDPSIWVEKRFGVGWTVNFGHPLGWGFLIGIILIVILLSIFAQ